MEGERLDVAGGLPPEIRDAGQTGTAGEGEPADAADTRSGERDPGAAGSGISGSARPESHASGPVAGAVVAERTVVGRSGADGSRLTDSPVSAIAPIADSADGPTPDAWVALLESEVARRLSAQLPGEPGESHSELMEQLSRAFETAVIGTALKHTRGRRIDAALKLGIGRNTITRKIQDLHLEDDG